MPISAFNRAAPNLIRICIDEYSAQEFTGRMYHRFKTVGTPFSSPAQLLAQMDSFYDELNYPERTVQMRSFNPHPASGRKEPVMARKKVNDLTDQTGECATFVVHVMYRQNATWQGNVLWAEKGQNCNFRSALELLKLMDSAMEQSQEPSKELPAGKEPLPDSFSQR